MKPITRRDVKAQSIGWAGSFRLAGTQGKRVIVQARGVSAGACVGGMGGGCRAARRGRQIDFRGHRAHGTLRGTYP